MTLKRLFVYCGVSLFISALIVVVGLVGILTISHALYILMPGTMICRTFLSSRYNPPADGDMLGDVLLLDFVLYALLAFSVIILIHVFRRNRRAGSACPSL